ncbi:MAG: hypothetical protein E7383_09425 [Ruminococcaceae bacterium]|nr:hypothetical protein [Oscillospiraceae bacterium]
MENNTATKVMEPDEVRKNKVQEITDRLETGIKELFDSEKYVTWLNTMSKFHEYSLNNTILIAMQRPDATMVAGYTQWQKDFERNVNKGEKAIRILAWNPHKEKVERDKIDPETHEPVKDENGNTVKEIAEVQRPSYKVVNVFDVSQTEGKEIPTLATELQGNVRNFQDFFEALKKTCPVPIEFENINGSARGYFHQKDQRIAIQEGMSEIQTIKTAIHEMAHQKLHSVEQENNQSYQSKKQEEKAQTRSEKEVEAESVAYTVCQHFGIDTSDYSFGYVAGWSQGKEMAELKASLLTIRRAAASMIDDIEGHIKEIHLEKIENMTIDEAAELLADRLDTFAYDTDPYSYNDMIDDREQALADLTRDLATGNNKSLDGVEDFLKGVIEADCLESAEAAVLLDDLHAFREKYLEVDNVQEVSKATITFYVAECMEFPSYGEYHETDNLKDAFEILDTIPPQRLNAVTGIGFVIHDENSAIDNGQYPLVQGDQIQYDAINMVDYYKDSPLVQGAITECEAILKEREAVKDSVKEVAAASKAEKPVDKVDPPTKKSLLADLKEKKAIVAERTAAKAAVVSKGQEVQHAER